MRGHRRLSAAVSGAAFCACAALGQDQPIWTEDGLIFPEGAQIPRSLTPVERRWLETHPLGAGSTSDTRATAAPTGPIYCAAEYEPMEAILFAWESYTSLLTEMIKHTTTTGDADVYVYVDSTTEQSSASGTIAAGGANMARVHFLVKTTDTVWIRDYGPRYIFEGDCRAVVDHVYNRPRPQDDTVPGNYATARHHAFYNNGLIHGGGNFHLDALGRSYVTRLINNENPGLTETAIHDIWEDFQNVDTYFFNPYSTSVDSTQHIDMWMQIIADDKVVISDWPSNSGSSQDQIADGAAAVMASRGYTVYRVPARQVSGVHYTYTNVLMCNNLVLVPLYTNSTVATHNASALATWQAAMPGKTVVQVDCQSIVAAAGVMHCIVMHVPGPRGGLNPTAYLKNLNGGEVLIPGAQTSIQWISDDDQAVSNVDILLSTDGGATFPTLVAAATTDDGEFTWTVPNTFTLQGRIRVLARDAGGRTGYDDSDADFTINGTQPCPGDLDGSKTVDLSDLGVMLAAYGACTGDPEYSVLLDIVPGGCIDLSDLGVVLANYGAICP